MLVGRRHVRFGAQDYLGGRAAALGLLGVEDHLVAGLGCLDDAARAADRRDTQRARQDSGVAGRARLLHHHAGDTAAVPVEQLSRAEAACQQDGAFRHRVRLAAAVQRHQQPPGHVFQVGQPLAQIGVDDAPHVIAQFAGDAVHCRLGRQPAVDRLADAAQPAWVGGNQAVGLQDFACLRARIAVVRQAVGDQLIEAAAHGLHGVRQPRQFGCRIIGQQAPWRMRRGQHGWADGQPRHQHRPGEASRQGGAQLLLGAFGGTGGGQRFDQQHRHRFQRLDLVGLVAARRPVLHHQHTERAAGPAHRHRQQGGIWLLAGLRPVGEVWMVLRIRQVHRVRRRRHQADDALTHPQPGATDRLQAQSFGGGQLQHVAGLHGVDRAYLRHQLAGDQARNLGQRRGAAGHQATQTGKQVSRRGHRRWRISRAWRSCGGRPAPPSPARRFRR